MTPQEAKTILDYINKAGYKPNEYEKGFLGNILNHSKISLKQQRLLFSIYAKATGGGIYQQRQKI